MRSAFSPNIKERRDCSTALFDAGGRHGGAVGLDPGPPGGDAGGRRRRARARARRPGEVWLRQRPLPGRHPPARPDDDLAPCRWTAPWPPTPSPAPTTPTSAAWRRAACRPARASSCRRAWSSRRCGSCAGGAPVPDVLGLVLANTRTPGRARGRPARPARRPPPGRAPPGRGGRAPRRRAACARPSPRCSTTPSAAPARPSPRCRTAASEAAGGARGRRRDRRRPLDPGRGRRSPATRMTRGLHRAPTPPGPGNCNCPPAVTRSAVYFVVRCVTDPDIPASAGRLRPGGGGRAARDAGQRPPAGRRGRAATWRPRAASSTPSSRRWAARWRCPRRARAR